MKNFFKNLILITLTVIAVVACDNSYLEGRPTQSGGTTITAFTPSSSDSKVDFTENTDQSISLNWEVGDVFTVFDNSGALVGDFSCTNAESGLFSNSSITLNDGASYTAIYPKSKESTLEDAQKADLTSEQNGDEIDKLSAACMMEATFTYSSGKDISTTFEHKKAIMTFTFESSVAPTKLVFKNGDYKTYEVEYTNITPSDVYYTSHIMIEPCEATSRTLTFTLTDDSSTAYDIRTVESSVAYLAGCRYTSPVSTLPLQDGSELAPLLISSPDQLRQLSSNVAEGESYEGIYFELTEDINLSTVTRSDDNYVEFTAIGSEDTPFKGILNGGGYTISGLYINQGSSYYQGLFGYIDGATIENLTVEGMVTGYENIGGIVGYAINKSSITNCCNMVEVSGGFYVGGIVGNNDSGTVTNCYNTAVVSGFAGIHGGIVGNNYATVTNCYNTAVVSGYEGIGGIAGNNYATVTNCYNTAVVSGDISYSVGGIVGNNFVTVKNCYYNNEVAPNVGIGSSDIEGATKGMSQTEMQDASFITTLNNNAYDYNTENPTLTQTCGWVAVTDGYPQLDFDATPTYTYDISYNSTEDVYEIHTANGLRAFADLVNNTSEYSDVLTEGNNDAGDAFVFGSGSKTEIHGILTTNINLGGIDSDGNGIADYEFTAIGSEEYPFKGAFNGGGYAISELYINQSSSDYQGLFGYIDGATIENLTVEGSVTGRYYIGGIVGFLMSGNITNCYNTAKISGDIEIGGIVGFFYSGNITNCYNTAEISGGFDIGGIVGLFDGGNITNCYNTAKISGDSEIGGIVGLFYSGNITNCYNTAEISGGFKIGGIVGFSMSGNITNCYYNNTVAPNVGIGYSYSEDNTEGMSEEKMKEIDFANTLNANVTTYNNTDPEIKACSWVAVTDGYPILDYNNTPSND